MVRQTKSRQRALGQTVRQTKGFGANGGSVQRVRTMNGCTVAGLRTNGYAQSGRVEKRQ